MNEVFCGRFYEEIHVESKILESAAIFTALILVNKVDLLTHKQKSDSNFLVAGVVRNCANHVKSDVKKIQDALAGVHNVSWLLVESDSDDQTVEVLKGLKNEITNFDFMTVGTLRDQMPIRTDRLAYCRNTFLEAIRSQEKYRNIDYVLVSDFDGMNTHLTPASIDSCWERNDWDVCTANQDGPYYDVWTIRHPFWSPNDCYEQYRYMLSLKVRAFVAYYDAVYSRMITIPKNAEWIEVDAAFGGLAIYKREAIISSRYAGITEAGVEICEHVVLSEGIKKAGFSIFLNPRLINTRRSEHINKSLYNIAALFLFGKNGPDRLKKLIRR